MAKLATNAVHDPGFMLPLVMSTLAGLATSLGAAVVFCLGTLPTPKQMAFTLGIAIGVMVTVSVFDLYLPTAWEFGILPATLSMFAGVAAFVAMEKLIDACKCAVPSTGLAPGSSCGSAVVPASSVVEEGMQLVPTTMSGSISSVGGKSAAPFDDGAAGTNSASLAGAVLGPDSSRAERQRQWRVGMIMMLALTAHNFPEGLAVAVSTLSSQRLGVIMTVAIALHNIPEGLTIATPIYAATGDRSKAFWLATVSGLSEPMGALTALLFLRPYTHEHPDMLSYITCSVGGIMTAVALHELVPEASQYQRPRAMFYGILVGACVMSLTLLVDV